MIVSCKKTFVIDNFSNGKAGEVILILDKMQVNESARNYIEEALTQPQPALNQIEPMFDLLHFENKDFTSHFQRHRNIVQFVVNPNYSSNTLELNENVWSKPQLIVCFKGNSKDSLFALFQQNESEIIDKIYRNDLKRVISYASTNNNPYIEKKITDKFGIHITVPKTYEIAREEDDFIWLRFQTARNDRFIMIYKTQGNDLSRDALIKTRNEKTKAYIPGAVLGAYPIVAEVYQYPQYQQEIKVGTSSGVELRGLWECVGDKMGGPFYNFSFIDKTDENVISIDGFVYAPQEDKRNYLREVEAIVKTVNCEHLLGINLDIKMESQE
jgi:hypothetical protein